MAILWRFNGRSLSDRFMRSRPISMIALQLCCSVGASFFCILKLFACIDEDGNDRALVQKPIESAELRLQTWTVPCIFPLSNYDNVSCLPSYSSHYASGKPISGSALTAAQASSMTHLPFPFMQQRRS